MESEQTKESYRLSPNNFVRQRIFTFAGLCYARLQLLNRSISVELDQLGVYFQGIVASKQAFSKASSKISWKVFEYLNHFFIREFYQDTEYIKFQDRYLVLATDGTVLEIPPEKALLQHFGGYDNYDKGVVTLAQSVKIYDVLNHLTVTNTIAPYNDGQAKGQSEKLLFDQQLLQLHQLVDTSLHQVILLADKYYPCFRYLHELPQCGIHFVFRCRTNFCREVQTFVQSGESEGELVIDLKTKDRRFKKKFSSLNVDTLTVRVVRKELSDGGILVLLTDLKATQLSVSEIFELYDLRWGEETSFHLDKYAIEIENFAAKTVNGIYQEFYAKTLTANITELLIIQAEEQLEEEQKQKNNIRTYQINRRIAIGLVKNNINDLLTGKSNVEQWLTIMIHKIKRHRSVVRPKRHFPKKRKHKHKFSMNLRRVT